MEEIKGSKSLIIAGREVLDPLDLNVSWAQLTLKEKDQLLSLVEAQYSKLIERAFKERPEATVIVLSKGEIVKVDTDFTSLEELHKLEGEHGAICIPILN